MVKKVLLVLAAVWLLSPLVAQAEEHCKQAVINEILADPPSKVDIDQDGVTGRKGTYRHEMVEIVNAGPAKCTLKGFTLQVQNKGKDREVKHKFTAEDILNPNQTIVIFGKRPKKDPQPKAIAGALVRASNVKIFQLKNDGATVFLVCPGGGVKSSFTYDKEGNKDQSLVKQPEADPKGSIVLHKKVSDKAYSPGTCANGKSFTSGCK